MSINRRESELFDRSCLVFKIKGYTFHNFYIPENIYNDFGGIKDKFHISLDEHHLRAYQKEHGEYTSKTRLIKNIIENDNLSEIDEDVRKMIKVKNL